MHAGTGRPRTVAGAAPAAEGMDETAPRRVLTTPREARHTAGRRRRPPTGPAPRTLYALPRAQARRLPDVRNGQRTRGARSSPPAGPPPLSCARCFTRSAHCRRRSPRSHPLHRRPPRRRSSSCPGGRVTPTLSASGSPARSEIPPDRVGDAPTSSTASVVGTSAETPLIWEGNTVPGGRAVAYVRCFKTRNAPAKNTSGSVIGGMRRLSTRPTTIQ